MTTWQPIAKTVTQYVDSNGNPYSGAVLKAYLAGTTTVTNIATSSTGATQVTSVALNASGYPAVSGNVIIPHISEDYKLSLYPTQTAADANSGALWTVDNMARDFGGVGSLPSADMVIGDQVVGYQGGVTKRLTLNMTSINGYEQGTWTPTLYGATTAGTTTYTNQLGVYTKIGNAIFFIFRLVYSNATGTGEARMGGFPFSPLDISGQSARYPINLSYSGVTLPSGKTLSAYLATGENFIRFTEADNTGFTFVDLQSELTISAAFYGSGMFFA